MSSVFGWCASHGRPDQWHHLCEGQYVSAVGVTIRCGCPNHEWPDDEEAI